MQHHVMSTKRSYPAVEIPTLVGRVWHRLTQQSVFPTEHNESTFLGIGPADTLPVTSRVVDPDQRDKAALFDAFVEARGRRRKGPSSLPADLRLSIISDIATQFPALRGLPGIEPWQPLALLAYLNGYARNDIQVRTCAAFVLMLWNPWADWLAEGWEGGRPFNVMTALEVWTPENRQPFAAWVGCPIWP